MGEYRIIKINVYADFRKGFIQNHIATVTPIPAHCTSDRGKPSGGENETGQGQERSPFRWGARASEQQRKITKGPAVRGVCPVGITPSTHALYQTPPVVSSSQQNYRLHHRFSRSQYHIVKEESLRSVLLTSLAAALLLLAVLRGEVDDGLAGARLVLARLAGLEGGLAGDDAVDF